MAAALLKLVLPLAAAGGALLAFSKPSHAAQPGQLPGSSPSPSPAPKPTSSPGQPTANVPSTATLAAIQAALLSADPAKMRAEADDLDRQGFKEQAATLRVAADTVEKAMAAAPVVVTGQPGVPTIPTPQSAPVPQVVVPQVDPARALAASLNLHLAASSKGRENKALVTQYEQQEQLRGKYAGKIDGLYGPQAALSLATDFGIVPTKPFYWPVNPTPAKNAYRKALLAFASQDPQRAQEWAAAANV